MSASKKSIPEGMDIAATSAALLRAAKRAHYIAYLYGEKVVLHRDGKTVEEEPHLEMYAELLAEGKTKEDLAAEYDAWVKSVMAPFQADIAEMRARWEKKNADQIRNPAQPL